MINIVKGTAFSLQQADFRGGNPNPTQYTGTGTVITAGELVYVNTGTGNVTAATPTAAGIRGFAIGNSYDGDCIESGKIAVYSLDGNSVIETDQVDTTGDSSTISLTSYPVGTPLYASQTNAGLVSKVSTGSPGPVIGWVYSVRSLQNATPFPAGVTQSAQNYPSLLEAYNGTPQTKSYAYKAQVNVPVLGIKLAATL